MKTSQQIAGAVALRSLGCKVKAVDSGALVDGVSPGLPADGKLEPTDVIVAVDGKPVTLSRDADPRDARTARRPDRPVHDPPRRQDEDGRDPDGRSERHLEAGDRRHLRRAGRVDPPADPRLDRRGRRRRTSAGLAFALEVLEKLGHNVDRGNKIAATGEIYLNGAVGPIGGIKQKTIGAREAGVDAFLVPAGQNATDAKRYADGLRIIPVKSFQQALRALATLPEKHASDLRSSGVRNWAETARFLFGQALARRREEP